MLNKHIGNFEAYALRSRRTYAFDIMLCAICCGASDLAKAMWRLGESPLRSALIATDFCGLIESKFRFQTESLGELLSFFREAAEGVLEGLPNHNEDVRRQDVRRQVLIAVPRPEEATCWHGVELLGVRVPPWHRRWYRHLRAWVGCAPDDKARHAYRAAPCKSILEVAISLQNKEFVAHSSCTNVIEHFWRGRSAKCGKVMLQNNRGNDMVTLIFLQVILVALMLPWMLASLAVSGVVSLLLGWELPQWTLLLPRLLPTTINDHFRWPTTSMADADANGVGGNTEVTALEEFLGLFHIPYVKRILYVSCHIAFTLLFCIVSFQPLCGPLNSSHFVLGYWVLARAFHQVFHTLFRLEYWWRGGLTWLDLSATALLLTAGCLRVTLDADTTAGVFGAAAVAPIYGLDGNLSRPTASLAGEDDLGVNHCGWSLHYEVLRVTLASASLAIFARCAEIFFLDFHSRSGVLILCAVSMIVKMGYDWLPPMLLFTCSFGVGLNLLAPDSNRQATAFSSMPFSSTPVDWGDQITLNLAVDGPFWAPFWGLFEYACALIRSSMCPN